MEISGQSSLQAVGPTSAKALRQGHAGVLEEQQLAGAGGGWESRGRGCGS